MILISLAYEIYSVTELQKTILLSTILLGLRDCNILRGRFA